MPKITFDAPRRHTVYEDIHWASEAWATIVGLVVYLTLMASIVAGAVAMLVILTYMGPNIPFISTAFAIYVCNTVAAVRIALTQE